MTRILHTADIHLDSPLRSLALRDAELRDQVQIATRTALERIVDTALSRSVAALLIAGDLFDGAERSARTAAFLTGQLDRLRTNGIRVFYIKGNHDAENPLTGELSLPDNVHVFDGRGGKVQLTDEIWIHGVSFAGRHTDESLLPRFQAPVEDAVNIAMLHTSLVNAEGHDPYAPCSVRDLVASGFDYWALGHVHRRQVHSTAPWVVMPGTPQGRDMGELGPKSATLLTVTDEIEVDEVPTSVVEFVHVEIDPADAATDDALRDLLRQRLHATANRLTSECGVVRLTLSGASPRRWQILRDQDMWSETAAQVSRETGRLWLDRLVLNVSNMAAPGQSATDELAKIMETIRQEPGFAETCRAELEAVLAELPVHRRGELLPDEDAMAALGQRLAETGAQGMLARMKGATS